MGSKYQFSPFGIAVHPWVNKPDTKFNEAGVFKTGLTLTGAEALKFKEEVDQQSDAYFTETTAEMSPAERKKWSTYYPYEEEEDDQGNKTGSITFDFKQNAVIRMKDGTEKKIEIGIKDAKNNDMHRPVFSGSELRTMFSFRGIKMTSNKQAGIRLDFAAVQVRKLQSSSGGGANFGVVEGYAEDQDHGADEDREDAQTGAPADKSVGGDY